MLKSVSRKVAQSNLSRADRQAAQIAENVAVIRAQIALAPATGRRTAR